jgi:hypothetical protein
MRTFFISAASVVLCYLDEGGLTWNALRVLWLGLP